MRFRILHKTVYQQTGRVTFCHNEARLTPANLPWQRVLSSVLEVTPAPARRDARVDFFGNSVTYLSIETPHKKLTILSRSEVEVEPPHPGLDVNLSQPWEDVANGLAHLIAPPWLEARPYVLASPLVAPAPMLRDYASASFPPGRPLLAGVLDLNGRIFREFTFDPEFSTIATPLADVMEKRRGVCQDYAHILIGCLRSFGLAARYVSGYIETLPPPGKPRLQGADASHAWVEAFDPDHGWVQFDPTNNQIPNLQHILIGRGRDFFDISPLKGIMIGSGGHKLKVEVDVERVEA
jgi:transglutaminase-like putative cysteine protease